MAVHAADVTHALDNEDVILGVDAYAADFSGHPAFRQRLGPIGVHFKPGCAALRLQQSGGRDKSGESQSAAGQSYS